MDGRALPVCYVKFDVTFRIARPARTIGLDGRFRPSAAPLRVPRTYPHPIAHFPDSERSVRSRPVFSYLPVGVSVFGFVAARCAVCRVSPFSTTVAPTHQQLLMSNMRERVSTNDNGFDCSGDCEVPQKWLD